MKKVILLIITCILIVSCKSDDNNNANNNNDPEDGLLTSSIGIWEGEGEQPGLSWTIKITINNDEQLIEYPSLGCSGFLTLVEESDTELIFRETITINTTCADQGFVKLISTSSTTMDYEYYFPNIDNEIGELGAFGDVTKN